MLNILVVGATGYIGSALTSSLTRSGDHHVYGLARTAEKALQLTKEEVTPIIGDINSPSLLSAIEDLHIDVVVDVSGANQYVIPFLLPL